MKSLILKLDNMSNTLSKTIFSSLGKVVLGFLSVGMIFLFAAPSGTYSAVQTVNLNLDGTGASSWNITNLAPGNEGFKSVTVHNTGPEAGQVTIWLSNIINGEGENPASETGNITEPGELDKYLRLKLSAPGLESNFPMPAYIKDFPQTEASDKHVRIARLGAGDSVDLTWKWDLPVETGNEVQGDTIKFDINYRIEDFNPVVTPTTTPVIPVIPGVPPEKVSIVPPDMTQQAPIRSIQIQVPGMTVVERTNEDGKIENSASVTAKSTEVKFTITLAPETKLVNPDKPDVFPHKIEAVVSQRTFPSLPGWKEVSPVFDVEGVTYGEKHSLVMDKSAMINIGYDPKLLPECYDDIAVFYFDELKRIWIQLEEPEGYVAELGTQAAVVDHFSIFCVLVKPSSGYPIGPARFETHDIAAGPSQIIVGDTASIKVGVNNAGGEPGDFTVNLLVNGNVAQSQSVTLAPLECREIYFTLTPENAGKYEIEIAGKAFDIKAINPPAEPIQPVEIIRKVVKAASPYAWLIFLTLGIVALMAVLFRPGKTQP